MKCDICNKEEATVHLTEVVNDKVTKLHLCERCAKEKSQQMQAHFGLTDLISGLMDIDPQINEEIQTAGPQLKCGFCGMTYYDFQKNGKLGCGKCYEAFSDELSTLLRKIHGSDRHLGKMPFFDAAESNNRETLNRLRQEMDDLIKSEKFEKAAIIRDRIREMESGETDKGQNGS